VAKPITPLVVRLIDAVSCTFLNFFSLGIKIGVGSVSELVQRILKSPQVLRRIKTMALLVIDECGMLSAELFRKTSEVFKAVRGNDAFMGGVVVLLIGDFRQLQPVPSLTLNANGELQRIINHYVFEDKELWNEARFDMYTLMKSWRFDNDPVMGRFMSLLKDHVTSRQPNG